MLTAEWELASVLRVTS